MIRHGLQALLRFDIAFSCPELCGASRPPESAGESFERLRCTHLHLHLHLHSGPLSAHLPRLEQPEQTSTARLVHGQYSASYVGYSMRYCSHQFTKTTAKRSLDPRPLIYVKYVNVSSRVEHRSNLNNDKRVDLVDNFSYAPH